MCNPGGFPWRLKELKLGDDEAYQVHDLLTEARYVWRGSRNFVQLDPSILPAHIFRGSSDRLTFAGLTDAPSIISQPQQESPRFAPCKTRISGTRTPSFTSFMYGRIATATATALAIFAA